MKKYPEGHFISRGVAIGLPLGLPLGLAISHALDSPGLIGSGMGIGLIIGLAIGQSQEDKAKKEGRIGPLTKKEKAQKNKTLIAGLIGLAIGVLAILIFLI